MRRLTTLLLAVLVVSAGLPAVAMAQSTTPTPTPTPTNATADDTSDSGGADVPVNTGPIAADLYVEQPRYVSDTVGRSKSDGINVYTVSGSVHELAPERFNHSQVIRSGVRESGATLRYDSGIGRWILDAQDTAGSYRVFWVVRQDGQEQTYEAIISVEQAKYEHVNPGQIEELKAQADIAEEVRAAFVDAGILSDEAGEEQFLKVVEDAVTWYEFYTSPFSALEGQFLQLAILLATWPAGWIIFGVLFLLYFIRDRKKTKQLRRLKRQFANIEDVDEAERQAWERELKRSLSMQTFEDLGLTATDAQAIREHFDISNPRQFLDKLRSWMSEAQWARILLEAHAQLGHVVVKKYDEDGELSSVELVKDPTATDGGVSAAEGRVEHVDPEGLDDETILALDWDSLDPGLLWDDRIDADKMDWPISNGPDDSREDLVDAMDVPIGEDGESVHIIERREEFADILLTIIKHIAASQYCDEDGRVRPEMDMIDFLFTFTTVGSEKYRWSLHNTADILLRNLQRLDADERMDDLVDRSRDADLLTQRDGGDR